MVRHGATVLSAEDRFAGVTDVDLSDEGREQARRLSERLSAEKLPPFTRHHLAGRSKPREFSLRRTISRCKHATVSGKSRTVTGKG